MTSQSSTESAPDNRCRLRTRIGSVRRAIRCACSSASCTCLEIGGNAVSSDGVYQAWQVQIGRPVQDLSQVTLAADVGGCEERLELARSP